MCECCGKPFGSLDLFWSEAFQGIVCGDCWEDAEEGP